MSRRSEVVELAVLGLLDDAPMHGYHLRKHVTTLLGPWRAALSFGTLYPALRRLLADGFVEADRSTTGSSRVVYRLTPAGRQHFRESLADSAAPMSDDDAFGVRYAFFARLTPAERIRLLEARRARLLDRLHAVRGRGGLGLDEGSRDPYRRAWALRGLASVESELRWTEENLSEERSSSDGAPSA